MTRFLTRLSQLPSKIAVFMVRFYQWTVRPILGPRCRYLPHCSDYAIESLERFGLFSGGWLTAKRLGRCHPWCAGGLDPVPEQRQQQSSSHTLLSD
jgi:putative membrane protein insertion efficiency factor